MARQNNETESVKITITTTKQVLGILKTLLKLGLYGKTVAEAAEQVMREKLREEIKLKRIRLLNPKDEEESDK